MIADKYLSCPNCGSKNIQYVEACYQYWSACIVENLDGKKYV